MALLAGDNGNPNASTTQGILSDVWDGIGHFLRVGAANGGIVVTKSITFTGAANLGATGTINLFTENTLGQSLVALIATCGTTLVGTGATIAAGISGSTARYLPQQTATNITAGKTWDLTGLVTAGTAPNTTPNQVSQISETIIATIATANITAGQLTFYAFYRPLAAGAALVAD